MTNLSIGYEEAIFIANKVKVLIIQNNRKKSKKFNEFQYEDSGFNNFGDLSQLSTEKTLYLILLTLQRSNKTSSKSKPSKKVADFDQNRESFAIKSKADASSQ